MGNVAWHGSGRTVRALRALAAPSVASIPAEARVRSPGSASRCWPSSGPGRWSRHQLVPEFAPPLFPGGLPRLPFGCPRLGRAEQRILHLVGHPHR